MLGFEPPGRGGRGSAREDQMLGLPPGAARASWPPLHTHTFVFRSDPRPKAAAGPAQPKAGASGTHTRCCSGRTRRQASRSSSCPARLTVRPGHVRPLHFPQPCPPVPSALLLLRCRRPAPSVPFLSTCQGLPGASGGHVLGGLLQAASPARMPQLRWIIPSLHHSGRCSGVAVCLPYQGSSGAGWPPAGWGSPAVLPGETPHRGHPLLAEPHFNLPGVEAPVPHPTCAGLAA